ncbi:MAG: protoheme IX farnesyltransferase [Geobacter sp.]|nr:protoheme IX farnesyltransferase [Geobacter sp.]
MITSVARLLRLPLALLNGIVAAGGYLLCSGGAMAAQFWLACGGVTLLGAGSSALNQVVERDIDAIMTRTRQRPLPRGDLSVRGAAAIGVLCLFAGCALLAATGSLLAVLLGVAAVLWYLCVYTPLKRRTSLSLALGALCGALPPVIGWCVAGGRADDPRIVLLAGLFYLWQIPHFWIFQQRHLADYRAAGLPLCAEGEQGERICRLWLGALAVASLLLPVFNVIDREMALWYALLPVPLLLAPWRGGHRLLFSYLNLFPLLVTMVISIQK